MGSEISSAAGRTQSEFLRRLLAAVAKSDIDVRPETLHSAAAYVQGREEGMSGLASIAAEIKVLKDLAQDMKTALAAERRRLFGLD